MTHTPVPCFTDAPPAIGTLPCPITHAELRLDSYRAETERAASASKIVLQCLVIPVLSVLGMATIITVAAMH